MMALYTRTGLAGRRPPQRLRPQSRPPWGSTVQWSDAAPAAHPLADAALSAALRAREEEIEAAFARIEPTLAALAPRQFEPGFAARAAETLHAELGADVQAGQLAATWSQPLDFGRLYGHCVLGIFRRLAEREFDRTLARWHEGESAPELIRRFGFHALDITPCADGRLAGVVDYILRVPPAVVAYRKSYAGALFDVEESLRHWEAVELRRHREQVPNAATEPTRFLKIGIYHFSSGDPQHEGCAAHGSDEQRAARELLARLVAFEDAVRALHGAHAAVATLLIGVDTDTDAIRVHVPDAAGISEVQRHVCARVLYEQTATRSREAAKEDIRHAVAECARVPADDPATEGMRWLCGYLLKNNLGQVDAVRRRYGGGYLERGHAERLAIVGDPFDEVQLRNLAFQAQMDTVEEGSADLAVGLRILSASHAPRGLAVPVLVHSAYDGRVPGARERAAARALRLQRAIESHFASQRPLVVAAFVRALGSAALEPVTVPPPAGTPCTEHQA